MNIINGVYVKEKNYSIVNEDVDVWTGELPWKRGSVFPTKKIKERADISHTNRLIYRNEIDSVYNNILQVYPETDPILGYQLRELVARLPYNKTSVEYYVAMVAGLTPFINGKGMVDVILNSVVENTNLGIALIEETRSRFLDQFSVYRLYSYNDRIKIEKIPSKNCVAFVNREHLNEIEVVVVFNIYKTDKGNEICEFVEYHNNGDTVKRVFNYNAGTLGREIEEAREESKAFNDLDISPIIFCRHNVAEQSEVYGTDQFRYWDASLILAMRCVQNISRYGERCREIIRQVPDGAIDKDNRTGRAMFINRGTVEYRQDADNAPSIKYIQPDSNMMQAFINELDSAMDLVSNSTGLGKVFFGIEKAGSNISAKSIEAMMYPTKLSITLIRKELDTFIKEVCIKAGLIAGLTEIKDSDISVGWRNTFPFDEAEHTNAIIARFKEGLLNREDAIAILDDVPLRIAKQRAAEIAGIELVNNDGDKKVEEAVDSNISSRENQGVSTGAAFEQSGETSDTGDEHRNGDDLNNPEGPVWEWERPLA